MIENNLYNIRLWTTVFMKTSNLVAYYGFDVETVMQLAANKQVDIIIVNTIYVAYGDKYREVDWIETEIIQMLKSNPETAQIPVIVKLSGQVMVGDQDRYLAESGADEAICVQVDSLNSLVEKIKHTLSADDSSLNTRINKNRIATYPEPKVGEGANLARFRNQLSNILTPEPRKFAIVRSRTASAIFFDSRGLNTPG
jgi:CheY-like chemotaxis protein